MKLFNFCLTMSLAFSSCVTAAMIIPEPLQGAEVVFNIDGEFLTINAEKNLGTLGTILCQSNNNGHHIHVINVFQKKNNGKGIGTHLLIVAMNRLLSEHKKNISLLCKHTLAPFYERVGFKSISSKKSKNIDMCYDPLTTPSPQECLANYYKNKPQMLV